jgi:hypothetical protein
VGGNYKPDASPEGVRVRVTKILNDAYHKGLQLGSIDVNLRRHAPTDDPESYAWAQYELRAGQQFLIFSESKDEGLAAMVESPRLAWWLTGKEDTVGDMSLILDTLPLPLPARVQAVTVAFSASPRPHCSFLADYISSLLASGSDSETSELASALESAPASAFSDLARGTLLDHLRTGMFDAVRSEHRNLASLFVGLAARYFLIEPDRAASPATSTQYLVLHCVHSMETFDLARAAVRALPPYLAKQFAQKAAALASDTRIQPDLRTLAVELRTLIEAKQ